MKPTATLSVLLFSTVGLTSPAPIEQAVSPNVARDGETELFARGYIGSGGCDVEKCLEETPRLQCMLVYNPLRKREAMPASDDTPTFDEWLYWRVPDPRCYNYRRAYCECICDCNTASCKDSYDTPLPDVCKK